MKISFRPLTGSMVSELNPSIHNVDVGGVSVPSRGVRYPNLYLVRIDSWTTTY